MLGQLYLEFWDGVVTGEFFGGAGVTLGPTLWDRIVGSSFWSKQCSKDFIKGPILTFVLSGLWGRLRRCRCRVPRMKTGAFFDLSTRMYGFERCSLRSFLGKKLLCRITWFDSRVIINCTRYGRFVWAWNFHIDSSIFYAYILLPICVVFPGIVNGWVWAIIIFCFFWRLVR